MSWSDSTFDGRCCSQAVRRAQDSGPGTRGPGLRNLVLGAVRKGRYSEPGPQEPRTWSPALRARCSEPCAEARSCLGPRSRVRVHSSQARGAAGGFSPVTLRVCPGGRLGAAGQAAGSVVPGGGVAGPVGEVRAAGRTHGAWGGSTDLGLRPPEAGWCGAPREAAGACRPRTLAQAGRGPGSQPCTEAGAPSGSACPERLPARPRAASARASALRDLREPLRDLREPLWPHARRSFLLFSEPPESRGGRTHLGPSPVLGARGGPRRRGWASLALRVRGPPRLRVCASAWGAARRLVGAQPEPREAGARLCPAGD